MNDSIKKIISKLWVIIKNKLYKWRFIIAVIVIVIVIGIPFIINCAYLIGENGEKQNTAFSASDLLAFYGSFLAFLGTVILGAVTVSLSKQSNSINERLLVLEEKSTIPLIRIVTILDYNELAQRTNLRFVSEHITDLGNQQSYFRLYFILENISEVDISSIELNSMEFDGKNIFNFNSENTLINKREKNESLIAFEPKELTPIGANNHVEINLNFTICDYFSNTYRQSIETKCWLGCSSYNSPFIWQFTKYKTSKPTLIQ